MVKKKKRYVFVDRNRIVAIGTAQELAKQLHTTANRIYNHCARTKAGKTHFKHMFLENEVPLGIYKEVKEFKKNPDDSYSRPDQKKPKVYAIYHGNDFIDVGTAQELVTKHNISPNSFYSRVSKTRRGKYKNNVIIEVPD